MKQTWLNKQGNNNCILFFNGWGMDESAANHLNTNDFDLYMFNDYNPTSIFTEKLGEYNSIYVVAWSLGVWAASVVLSNTNLNISKAIAINGTQHAIDDSFGIPPIVFNSTLNNWNERNRDKFNMRILGGRNQFMQFKNCVGTREIENQKEELINIQKEVSNRNFSEINFDCALVGKNDLIFTTINQLNYWKGKTRIIEKDLPHYPFNIFKNWKEIINL